MRTSGWLLSLALVVTLAVSRPACAVEEGARPWWPWLLVATGGGLLVTGGVLWGVGVADYDQVQAAIDDAGAVGIIPMTQRSAAARQDRGDLFVQLGPAFVGVGAALAVTGTVLLLALPPAGHGEVIDYPAWNGPTLQPLVGPECLGAVGTLRF
jgi:hypothetical protein